MKIAHNIAAAGIAIAALTGCEIPEENAEDALNDAAGQVAEDKKNSETEEAVAEEKPEPKFTPEQDNAIRSGLDYLEFSGFSKAGLIGQLSSAAGDGYPKKVAIFAVNEIEKRGAVDWKAEAVESAKGYLDFSTFSCDGLVDQLSSNAGEQFTVAEAQFAAKKVGLC